VHVEVYFVSVYVQMWNLCVCMHIPLSMHICCVCMFVYFVYVCECIGIILSLCVFCIYVVSLSFFLCMGVLWFWAFSGIEAPSTSGEHTLCPHRFKRWTCWCFSF
jgi:hypothetical protein